ncbi:MAG: MazG family protein [Caldilineaceae bacterium]|nr:MazG family protein [Caldilineaceae bacterium]MCB9118124.1 MazG family protein [Caldilineaceae bacterium]MCB9123294.1 MazG family protein [Caldilineaceae bacterium]
MSRNRIQIVGLGPGPFDQLTLGAWQALQTAPCVLLRTDRHPCVTEVRAGLRADALVQSCDDLYESHAEFDDVYAAIVERVLALAAAHETVVYAVPGHPAVGEATTPRIRAAAAAAGFAVELIGGLSFVEPSFAAVGIDPMDGGQVIDAMIMARQHHPMVDVNLPLLLAQVYARWLASDVKLTLLNAYPADHAVTVVTAAGSPQQRLVTLPLAELDHGDHFDHLTSVYVPPLPPHSSFTALQELVAHLRAPEGCPWDREQTLESLRGDLLDECAELLEAIDAEADGSDESAAICEELGDVLLSAVMMTQIATEEGRFQMGDAVRGIVTKLIRRHPHVFGDVSVSGVDHVLANWDVIKAQEKAEQGVTRGPLDGIPPALPALQKARKLQSKAAKAGLLDRAALAQSEPAVAALFGGAADEARFGAVLWQVVALAHAHDVDAEDALRSYAVRFRRDAV